MLWRFGFALSPSVLSPGFNPAGASGGQPVGECSGATPLEEWGKMHQQVGDGAGHPSDDSGLTSRANSLEGSVGGLMSICA